MFSGSRPSIEGKDFCWYTKRLAVMFSFGYLVVLGVCALIGLIPRLHVVMAAPLIASGPVGLVADAFLNFASDGQDCSTNWWDDLILQAFGWALFAFLAWFEYFAIGWVSGLLIDTGVALRRRWFHLG